MNGPVGNAITCTDWNADGTLLAYGVSYDYSKGAAGEDKAKPNHVAVHKVVAAEISKRKPVAAP
jgi:mRNA export factor